MDTPRPSKHQQCAVLKAYVQGGGGTNQDPLCNLSMP
jgi:hypothetical protein